MASLRNTWNPRTNTACLGLTPCVQLSACSTFHWHFSSFAATKPTITTLFLHGHTSFGIESNPRTMVGLTFNSLSYVNTLILRLICYSLNMWYAIVQFNHLYFNYIASVKNTTLSLVFYLQMIWQFWKETLFHLIKQWCTLYLKNILDFLLLIIKLYRCLYNTDSND